MAKSKNQKLKILCLIKMLLCETDEDHVLTVPQMVEGLEKQEIHAERKSIYDDIDALRDFGFDIVYRKAAPSGYFIANREFQLPELKLLADAVASSRFLTERKSAQLIHKIEGLSSKAQAVQLQRQIIVCGRAKTANEQIYYNIDKINEAITQKRPIGFQYFEYRVNWNTSSGWEKAYRREGSQHVAFPYALGWDSENYYMTAYYERYNGISNFRVDKMERIEMLPENAVSEAKIPPFDAASYSKKVFGMFSGDEMQVTLRCDDSLIGVVLDQFGKDAAIRKAEGGGFLLTADMIAGPPLYGRLLGFGSLVKVLEPQSLVRKLRGIARENLAQYAAADKTPTGQGRESIAETEEKQYGNK